MLRQSSILLLLPNALTEEGGKLVKCEKNTHETILPRHHVT